MVVVESLCVNDGATISQHSWRIWGLNHLPGIRLTALMWMVITSRIIAGGPLGMNRLLDGGILSMRRSMESAFRYEIGRVVLGSLIIPPIDLRIDRIPPSN